MSLERKARVSRGVPSPGHLGARVVRVKATQITQRAGSQRTRRAARHGHRRPAPPGGGGGPGPPRGTPHRPAPRPRVTGLGRAALTRPEMPLFSVPKEVAVGTAMLGVAFATGMLAGKRRPPQNAHAGVRAAPSPCPPPGPDRGPRRPGHAPAPPPPIAGGRRGSIPLGAPLSGAGPGRAGISLSRGGKYSDVLEAEPLPVIQLLQRGVREPAGSGPRSRQRRGHAPSPAPACVRLASQKTPWWRPGRGFLFC